MLELHAADRFAPRLPDAARRSNRLGSAASYRSIVGTHALIEESVEFARLGVGVVDEQHRFGVRQRAALDAQGRPAAPRRTSCI